MVGGCAFGVQQACEGVKLRGVGAGQAKPGQLSAIGACSPSARANCPIRNANLQIGWAQAAKRIRHGGAEGQTLWLRPQTIMFPV